MRRATLALVTLACLSIAGCTAGPPAFLDDSPTPSSAETPTLTPTPSGFSPTEDVPTPTRSASATRASPSSSRSLDGRTVEYLVRAGSIPEEFASVTVTFRVVFVERAGDLGPCYPDVFSGPYKPTITPIGTPVGACHRSEPIEVTLPNVTGERSLGNFTASAGASGHALVVTGLTARLENGSIVGAIKGVGGAELLRSSNPPRGTYGVELGIEAVPDDRDYDYWLVWERFDPSD